MKKRVLMLLGAAGALLAGARAQAQVVVIVNPGIRAAAAAKSDLRDVFTGSASSLRDGSRVTPVLLKSGPANEGFLAEIVGKSESAFTAGWRSLVFSGQASMPKTLDSEATMVDYVAHTPGAIGYVSKGTPHEGVKVLEVQ